MIFLDLKLFIFILIVIVVLVLAVMMWAVRFYKRQSNNIFFLYAKELQAVLEPAPFGWLVLDKTNRYLYANLYTRNLLELPYTTGDVPATVWATLLEEDRAVPKPTENTSGRYRRVVLSFGKIVKWWIFPLSQADIVFLLDVTGEQRAQESGRQLLSNLSHELRTPLAGMLTHLEVLSMPQMPEETAQQSLQLLKRESRQMSRLVNQMLELGRIESDNIDRRYIDILPVAEEAVSQVMSSATEKGSNILVKADAPLPPVLGDDTRLRQVFLNLLDNAVKHNPPGTQIDVILKQTTDSILCAVTDDGSGISAEHLPYVTRRFYRAAPQKTEGSGLGLALAVEILRRHQSKLLITSHTEGAQSGVEAQFTLPFAPQQDSPQ